MAGVRTSGPFTVYSDIPLDWQAAENHCVSYGGHLASVRTMSENSMVHDLCTPNECWIGFNDKAVEGTWVWSDGSPSDFATFPDGKPPWNPGEPNGLGDGPADGAYIYPNTNVWVRAGTWDDDDVGKSKPFVCRNPLPPPSPPSPHPPPMPTTSGGYRYELIQAGVECKSKEIDNFGKQPSYGACADKCAEKKNCRFFIFGTSGTKAGDCYSEKTKSASCPEGWEVDQFDFYELQAPWVGCTEPHARNYDSKATVDGGMCEEWDACAETPPGRREWSSSGWVGDCLKWRSRCKKPCDQGNDGYRNKDFDTVYAGKALPAAIQVDGDLRDWREHDPRWQYTDVAFANTAGDEVVFETQRGGKWYGPTDFSTSWMMRWDENFLYLALDVIDDTFTVGEKGGNLGRTFCWKTGLQLGFEVGGPGSHHPGALQAERSADLDISRLDLINIGFFPGQARHLLLSSISTFLPMVPAIPDAQSYFLAPPLAAWAGELPQRAQHQRRSIDRV